METLQRSSCRLSNTAVEEVGVFPHFLCAGSRSFFEQIICWRSELHMVVLFCHGFNGWLINRFFLLVTFLENAVHSETVSGGCCGLGGSYEWHTDSPRSHSTCLLHRWRKALVPDWLWRQRGAHSVHVTILIMTSAPPFPPSSESPHCWCNSHINKNQCLFIKYY